MRFFLVLSTVFLLFTIRLFGQETVFEEARTIYKREFTYGAMMHTRGWGLNYRNGVYTTGFTRRMYEFEFTTVKSPKEVKIISASSSGYVFGKLNHLWLLRTSVSRFNTFIAKQSVRGIAISYVLNAGISWGYAKPVYLEIIKPDLSSFISVVERYDPDIHDQSQIFDKASFLHGLFKGRFYPGLFLRAGLNFESSRNPNRINSIEVGATMDAFTEKVPIMANDLNEQFLLNLYVLLNFGEKRTE